MPYVPSKKTDGKAEDREIIDRAVEIAATAAAKSITDNRSLIRVYKKEFLDTALALALLMNGEAEKDPSYVPTALATAAHEAAKPYGYQLAELGELNYAITRFIQRVPQLMVANGKWPAKDEIRYWLYAGTASALIHASRHTEDLELGIDGVFKDIKDEYKWRVNRSYEIAQIIKSGDCYDTPFYNKPLKLVDEDGKEVGYVDVCVVRSPETLGKDTLDFDLVLRKRSK